MGFLLSCLIDFWHQAASESSFQNVTFYSILVSIINNSCTFGFVSLLLLNGRCLENKELQVSPSSSHTDGDRVKFPGDSSRVSTLWRRTSCSSGQFPMRPPGLGVSSRSCAFSGPEVQGRTSGHIYGAAGPALLTVPATCLTHCKPDLQLPKQPWSFPAFLCRSRTTSCLTATSRSPASLWPSIPPQTAATSAPAAAAASPPPPLWTPSASPLPLSATLQRETSLWMI